ncbi:MAG: hypothetical protein SV062_03045 [Thermodesulfobacteriota bacterium]|nr:hypothetical protein [Thermodesulfobacteriota bacterium]
MDRRTSAYKRIKEAFCKKRYSNRDGKKGMELWIRSRFCTF